jgi:DNA-binding IscR family transcriptional regulator
VDGPLTVAIPMADESNRREFALDQRLHQAWEQINADTRRKLDRIHISDLAGGNPDRAAGKRGPKAKAKG